jgi:hypothetical protein
MRLRIVAATMCFAIIGVAAQEPGLDPATGLKLAGNWELVRANCTACHSARLITQQRGSADHWLKLIRWMQATQNLWQFPADVEQKIVAYLARHYPSGTNPRRAPVPRDLLPPNPHAPVMFE